MYAWNVSPTIRNCIFHGNSTAAVGGGLCLYGVDTNSTVTNSLFYGNTGDAMWNSAGSVSVINCTIVDNVGWGVTSADGTTVDNSIV